MSPWGPRVHREESRSGPRRRSLFRSGIRNAGRSDIDASWRTRLAGPDPEFAVLVSHPSFGPTFPEKLELRSHRNHATLARHSGGGPRGTQEETPGPLQLTAALRLPCL
jgi:hypothetical protein